MRPLIDVSPPEQAATGVGSPAGGAVTLGLGRGKLLACQGENRSCRLLRTGFGTSAAPTISTRTVTVSRFIASPGSGGFVMRVTALACTAITHSGSREVNGR